MIHTHVQSMLRSTTYSTPQDGRNQSIDKSGPQENINMDGKSQETIHMHHNLIYTMATTSGRKLLIWKLSKSKNIKYSQMFEMHTSKHSQGRNFTLWVGLNLKNYKDMFLSCTKHLMVQDQEEHDGMINSLTYSITWVSRPQKLIGVVMTLTPTM